MPATIAFRSETKDTPANAADATYTPTTPSGVVTGDFVAVMLTITGSGSTIATPSGWTLYETIVSTPTGGTLKTYCFGRVWAGGTMPGFVASTGGNIVFARIYTAAWTNTATVVSSTGGGSNNTGSAVVDIPSISPVSQPTRDIYIYQQTADNAGVWNFVNQPDGSAAAGFTLHGTDSEIGDRALAATGATGTTTDSHSGGAGRQFHVWRFALGPSNNAPTAPVVTAPNGGESINASTTITWTAGSDPDGDALTYDLDYSRDNGTNWVSITTGVSGTSYSWNTSAIAASTACLVRIRSSDTVSAKSAYDQSNAVFTIQHNVAPLAPTLTTPPGSGVIDRAIINRLAWTVNDPDAGDSQSKFDLQWRLGAGSWNAVTGTTTNPFWDSPAATFPAGSIEWQVRTYDALGVVGPWSASSFFTAASAPAAPTITYPTNGGTIATSTDTVSWSTPNQAKYRVRKLADNAGSAADPSVPANVYYDSGLTTSITARNAPLTYPTNNRYEHVQVQIEYGGLLSPWASVRVLVSLTPPLNPTLVAIATDATASIQVSITNPLGNLLTTNQASIETDGTGWSAGGATTGARSTVQALSGAASYAGTINGGGGSFYVVTNGRVSVVPGQVYTIVVSMRAGSTPRLFDLAAGFWNAAGVNTSNINKNGALSDHTAGWVQGVFTVQAPAGATTMHVAIVSNSGSLAAGEVHYVDAAAVYETPTGNLVQNSDFDSGVVGWTVGSANVTQTIDATRAYTGRTSLKLVCPVAGDEQTSVNIPAVAGQTYTISAYVNCTAFTAAASSSRGLMVYDVGNTPNAQVATLTGLTSGWVRKTVTITPTTSSGIAIRLYAPNGTVYWDAVQAVVGGVAQTWLPLHTENLITNPSSEVASTFQDNGLNMARVTTDSWTGTASVYGAKNVAGFATIYRVNPAVVGVGRHVLSFYAKGVGQTSVIGAGTPVTGIGSWTYTTGTPTVTLTPNWTRYVIPIDVTQTGDFYLGFGGSDSEMPVGSSFYVDGIQLERGESATPYVDGSLGAAYLWQASENLLSAANASFEDGTVGNWVPGNGTGAAVANSAVRALQGTKSMLATAGSGAADAGPQLVVSVAPNTTYTVSMDLYQASLVGTGLRAAVWDATASTMWQAPLFTTVNVWVRSVVTFRTGPTTTSVNIVAGCTTSLGSTAQFNVDGVQLEQKEHPTAYASAGTAHSATSRRQFVWELPYPAAISNEVWIDENDGLGEQRMGKNIANNGTWIYWVPRSLRQISIRVKALAANGTSSWST